MGKNTTQTNDSSNSSVAVALAAYSKLFFRNEWRQLNQHEVEKACKKYTLMSTWLLCEIIYLDILYRMKSSLASCFWHIPLKDSLCFGEAILRMRLLFSLLNYKWHEHGVKTFTNRFLNIRVPSSIYSFDLEMNRNVDVSMLPSIE